MAIPTWRNVAGPNFGAANNLFNSSTKKLSSVGDGAMQLHALTSQMAQEQEKATQQANANSILANLAQAGGDQKRIGEITGNIDPNAVGGFMGDILGYGSKQVGLADQLKTGANTRSTNTARVANEGLRIGEMGRHNKVAEGNDAKRIFNTSKYQDGVLKNQQDNNTSLDFYRKGQLKNQSATLSFKKQQAKSSGAGSNSNVPLGIRYAAGLKKIDSMNAARAEAGQPPLSEEEKAIEMRVLANNPKELEMLGKMASGQATGEKNPLKAAFSTFNTKDMDPEDKAKLNILQEMYSGKNSRIVNANGEDVDVTDPAFQTQLSKIVYNNNLNGNGIDGVVSALERYVGNARSNKAQKLDTSPEALNAFRAKLGDYAAKSSSGYTGNRSNKRHKRTSY